MQKCSGAYGDSGVEARLFPSAFPSGTGPANALGQRRQDSRSSSPARPAVRGSPLPAPPVRPSARWRPGARPGSARAASGAEQRTGPPYVILVLQRRFRAQPAARGGALRSRQTAQSPESGGADDQRRGDQPDLRSLRIGERERDRSAGVRPDPHARTTRPGSRKSPTNGSASATVTGSFSLPRASHRGTMPAAAACRTGGRGRAAAVRAGPARAR